MSGQQMPLDGQLPVPLDNRLRALSPEELQEVLENDEKMERLVLDSEEVQNLQLEREMSLATNRSLAESNLGLQPRLERGKAQLLEKYGELRQIHQAVTERHQKLESHRQRADPEGLLAVLQAEGAKVEDESEELAEAFLSGQCVLDAFLERYAEQRRLAHARRVRVEKLQEILQRRDPPAPPSPAGSPRPDPAPRSPTPAPLPTRSARPRALPLTLPPVPAAPPPSPGAPPPILLPVPAAPPPLAGAPPPTQPPPTRRTPPPTQAPSYPPGAPSYPAPNPRGPPTFCPVPPRLPRPGPPGRPLAPTARPALSPPHSLPPPPTSARRARPRPTLSWGTSSPTPRCPMATTPPGTPPGMPYPQPRP
ncbi:vacuolar protein sorting-associated protein 37C isoform X2 [Hemitrygon akajei]|uniref:vacuolar protein sorting-associated protein 37C isoform X2 n=1 Tax=Hemitrygon akajei TaxID=2704970 RepID=UPI003BF98A5C